MRRYLAFAFVSLLAAGPALAAATSSQDLKPAANRHEMHRSKAKTPTAGHPLPSSPSDPKAGTNDQGEPNTTVTNGGEFPPNAH
jgi:hypothetical protein